MLNKIKNILNKHLANHSAGTSTKRENLDDWELSDGSSSDNASLGRRQLIGKKGDFRSPPQSNYDECVPRLSSAPSASAPLSAGGGGGGVLRLVDGEKVLVQRLGDKGWRANAPSDLPSVLQKAPTKYHTIIESAAASDKKPASKSPVKRDARKVVQGDRSNAFSKAVSNDLKEPAAHSLALTPSSSTTNKKNLSVRNLFLLRRSNSKIAPQKMSASSELLSGAPRAADSPRSVTPRSCDARGSSDGLNKSAHMTPPPPEDTPSKKRLPKSNIDSKSTTDSASVAEQSDSVSVSGPPGEAAANPGTKKKGFLERSTVRRTLLTKKSRTSPTNKGRGRGRLLDRNATSYMEGIDVTLASRKPGPKAQSLEMPVSDYAGGQQARGGEAASSASRPRPKSAVSQAKRSPSLQKKRSFNDNGHPAERAGRPASPAASSSSSSQQGGSKRPSDRRARTPGARLLSLSRDGGAAVRGRAGRPSGASQAKNNSGGPSADRRRSSLPVMPVLRQRQSGFLSQRSRLSSSQSQNSETQAELGQSFCCRLNSLAPENGEVESMASAASLEAVETAECSVSSDKAQFEDAEIIFVVEDAGNVTIVEGAGAVEASEGNSEESHGEEEVLKDDEPSDNSESKADAVLCCEKEHAKENCVLGESLNSGSLASGGAVPAAPAPLSAQSSKRVSVLGSRRNDLEGAGQPAAAVMPRSRAQNWAAAKSRPANVEEQTTSGVKKASGLAVGRKLQQPPVSPKENSFRIYKVAPGRGGAAKANARNAAVAAAVNHAPASVAVENHQQPVCAPLLLQKANAPASAEPENPTNAGRSEAVPEAKEVLRDVDYKGGVLAALNYQQIRRDCRPAAPSSNVVVGRSQRRPAGRLSNGKWKVKYRIQRNDGTYAEYTYEMNAPEGSADKEAILKEVQQRAWSEHRAKEGIAGGPTKLQALNLPSDRHKDQGAPSSRRENRPAPAGGRGGSQPKVEQRVQATPTGPLQLGGAAGRHGGAPAGAGHLHHPHGHPLALQHKPVGLSAAQPPPKSDKGHSPAPGAGSPPPLGPKVVFKQKPGVHLGLPQLIQTLEPLGNLPSELQVDPADLNFIAKVGSGASADVWRATWRGADVAVKILHSDTNSSIIQKDSSSELYRELQIMVKLRHPNLVLFMGAPVAHTPMCLVTEFCSGGSLFDLLHGNAPFAAPRNRSLDRRRTPRAGENRGEAPAASASRMQQRRGSESSALRQGRKVKLSLLQKVHLCLDVAKGCLFLHTMKPQIIHRDLKSLNILLANPVRGPYDAICAKITDFGLSRFTRPNTYEIQHGWSGTVCWMAPELFAGRPFNEKIDVYAFGVIVFEIVSGTLPYVNLQPMSPEELGMRVTKGLRPDLSFVADDTPKELIILMNQCWVESPQSRPSFASIVKSLKSIEEAYCRG